MPEPSTSALHVDASATPRPVPAGDDYLRLVLFGLPEAGKSSLLGALGEAANSQMDLLGGRVMDLSQGLTELSRALYAGSPPETVREVVSYPIEYDPVAASLQLAGERGSTTNRQVTNLPPQQRKIQALLVDCDGRVANEMLLHQQAPDEDSPEGTLAHEIVEADTLILVVDSSAPRERIETDFAEFNRFLKIMEHDRGRRVEVSGLPVFLVLTKCDLLACLGDSSADWIDRIEQRKRDVDAHFREFLENEEARGEQHQVGAKAEEIDPSARDFEKDMLTDTPTDGTSIFGGIDLHVWATAVKRPELAGTPAKPREPYGVAELFRQCLGEAQRFRRREERSSRRIVRISIGSVIVALGLLALVVTLFVVNRNTRLAMLAARVEDFRALDHGPPARRLRGTPAELREKQTRLQDLHNDPLFSSLQADLRNWVDQRIEELEAYIPWYEKVIEEPPPEAERTEDGLEKRLSRLKKDLAVPRPEWSDTDAALIVQQRLKDAEALRKATQDLRNWYLDSSEAAAKLWTFAGASTPTDIDWGDWTTQTETLVAQNRRPPFDATSLTYVTAMHFDKVIEARSGWESERARLNRLLQVCSALGLATPSADRPAVLVFPRNVSLALSRDRLAEMKLRYPDYATVFVRDTIPDVILPRVRQVARVQYNILLTPARAEVLQQYRVAGKGKEERTERWNSVRTWLNNPEGLAAWRVLAGILLHLDEPAAEDPVTALASFLGKKEFAIELRGAVVEIPELRPIRPRVESRLTVYTSSDRKPALVLEPSGEPRRDAGKRLWLYTYRLAEGSPRLTYKPGETFWVELPLRGGKERLAWSRSRSALYQFECLRNPPRLQAIDASSPTEGRLIDDVRLILTPEDGVPKVPGLLPDVSAK